MQAKESGFSLIEIMIVMGLLGLMAAFMMSVTKIGLTGQRNVAAMDDARNVTREMSNLLMSSDACVKTFGGLDPTVAGGASVTALKDAAGTAIYQVNTIYGNRAVRLKGVILGGTGLQPKMNLQRFAGMGTGRGQALAEINWSKVGDTSGADVLSRYFYVNVVLDTDSKITDCSVSGMEGGGGSPAWRTTCPAGYLLAGAPGTPEAFCIGMNPEPTARTWGNAMAGCYSKGARLCTVEEWGMGCAAGMSMLSGGPNGLGGALPEWTSSPGGGDGGSASFGGSYLSVISKHSTDGCGRVRSGRSDDTVIYRCCFR